MNEADPIELEPDVLALLEAERTPDSPPAGAKERVWERVHESIVSGSPPTPVESVATAGGSSTAVVVGATVVALVAVVGTLTFPDRQASDVAAPPPPAPAHGSVSSLLEAPPAAVVPEPLRAPVVAPIAPRATASDEPGQAAEAAPPGPVTSSAVARARHVDRLEEERRLLDAGRGALRAGRAQEALGVATKHRARFPRGRLVEEREALRIRALDRLGRGEEAHAAAQRFLSRFKASIHRGAVERILHARQP